MFLITSKLIGCSGLSKTASCAFSALYSTSPVIIFASQESVIKNIKTDKTNQWVRETDSVVRGEPTLKTLVDHAESLARYCDDTVDEIMAMILNGNFIMDEDSLLSYSII